VRQAGRWGFVDKTGNLIINPQFDEAASFTNGLARVKTGGRFGYVAPSGKFVYSPTN
jgi:hypothetical protein